MLPLILLASGSVISWIAWVYVLFRFDPFVDGFAIHSLFQSSLVLALTGTFTIIALLWHKKRVGRMASRQEASIIVRQVLLGVIFLILVLNLAAINLLRWWNIVPLAMLILTIEFFFMSLGRGRRKSAK